MAKLPAKETPYFVYLPTELKNQFKAHCSKRGKSMKQVLVRLMKKHIRS